MTVSRFSSAPKMFVGWASFGPSRGAYSPAPAALLDLKEASPVFLTR